MEVDRRADEVVYRAHASELVRFATGLVGVDDAPDVVVDAFLRVSASTTWAEARDKRALWLRTIVFESRSLARSADRRRARERRAAVLLAVPLGECVELPTDVIEALEQLSDQQRAVVVLTYWMDLDPMSVASLLELSEGSVRKQLARARARMREVLS